MSFDFELDHRPILTCNLEVDVIVLSLYSLLQRQKVINNQVNKQVTNNTDTRDTDTLELHENKLPDCMQL